MINLNKTSKTNCNEFNNSISSNYNSIDMNTIYSINKDEFMLMNITFNIKFCNLKALKDLIEGDIVSFLREYKSNMYIEMNSISDKINEIENIIKDLDK